MKWRHMNHEEFWRLAATMAKSDLEIELLHRMNMLLNQLDETEDNLQAAEDTLDQHGFIQMELPLQ